MAERRMLRQIMSPSDIYAHAESICDMLREQYGSYDADSLEEVLVDESFGQRLKARGYDLLGEGGETVDAGPLAPRRDVVRMDVGPSTNMRRPGDRSLPVRRGTNDSAVPMRRREGPSDSSVPLRRGERSNNDGGAPRRRENGTQGDGMGQMRRRDGVSQNDGVPMRRRDNRPVGDMIPAAPSLDPPSNVSAPSPRRGWDSARENAPPTPPPTESNVAAPVQPTVSTRDVSPPVVEVPTQSSQLIAEAVSRPAEAPVVEAPAVKPTPRTRRTTRSRTKADPDSSAN